MTENKKLLKIKRLLESEDAIRAKDLFQEIEPENSVLYLMVQGLLEQKFQKWGQAINTFQKVLQLEPDNEEAKNHIQLINSILNFWNPETFNP